MDLALRWDPDNSRADWVMAGADLALGDDLKSAITISLFTDRLAEPDDVIPDGTTDRRGWWADDPTNRQGSRIWLLDRAKQTDDTLKRAYDYIVEALQWLIDDGVVVGFHIEVQWVRRSYLGAFIESHQPSGAVFQSTYAWAWAGIN